MVQAQAPAGLSLTSPPRLTCTGGLSPPAEAPNPTFNPNPSAPAHVGRATANCALLAAPWGL